MSSGIDTVLSHCYCYSHENTVNICVASVSSTLFPIRIYSDILALLKPNKLSILRVPIEFIIEPSHCCHLSDSKLTNLQYLQNCRGQRKMASHSPWNEQKVQNNNKKRSHQLLKVYLSSNFNMENQRERPFYQNI